MTASRSRGWAVAAVCAAALLPGCLPKVAEPYRCVIGPPAAVPLDVGAATLLGPTEAPRPSDVEPLPPPKGLKDPLRIPPELPGADAPPIKLPPLPKDEAERDKVIGKLYPTLPPLEPEPQPPPGPEGKPLTLADLQALASANSPTLRRAAADIEAARGLAVQASLYPNPTVGYFGEEIQPGGADSNAGKQGVFIEQIIKTGGKLQLARAVAGMDAINAEVALRQAQVDLAAKVRAGYFAVLVARESVRVSRALAELADEVFRIQVLQVKGGQAAAYEPLQLYVFAVQARNNLVQARNRHTSAWRQLAAAMGVPDLPPAALAGRAETAVPAFDYDRARDHLLAAHTALRSAENGILKAQHALRLAEVNRLPDVHAGTAFMHDNGNGQFMFNVEVGVSLPLWDRNQGNLRAARAQVARAEQELAATRNDLVQRLAEAFERYRNNRALVLSYREQILGNQVRVYRAIRDRYQQEPDKITYADIVNAQQILAGSLTTYLGLLASQWAAVVDVAQLLQLDDLYLAGHDDCLGPVTALQEILHAPAPCSLPVPPARPASLAAPTEQPGPRGS